MADRTQDWAYCEESAGEGREIAAARDSSRALGVEPVSPAAGRLLEVLARTVGAKAVVEIGTGAGVSGLHLLAVPGLVLTTIDTDGDAQRSARAAFTVAGHRANRVRVIEGDSTEILPRLASRNYDMVLIDGDPSEVRGDFEEALRLLRAGGLIVVAHALQNSNVPDPARREDNVVAMRNLIKDVEANDELDASLLPVGDGVLLVLPRA